MQRCPQCPGVHNCVPPDGPASKYVFIGEAPGRDEDKRQTPFVGKTGEELNRHYLPLAGLRREGIYCTNAIKCLPPGPNGKLDPNRQKDRELLESCATFHLYEELEAIRPELIIPMGSFACRSIDPYINLELHHGIPRQTAWGTVFPMYHPALGIHEPKKMLHIRTDWVRLRKYLKNQLLRPVDDYAGKEDYRALDDPVQLNYILSHEWAKPLACDTETTYRHEPFCLTFSVRPGTGYLIRADDRACLDVFQMHLDMWRGPILFHNWLFDSAVVERMGLRFNPKRIVDTMVRVFHLGNLPQGLKALSYRELGMEMQDFEDLVKPHSTIQALRYLREAYSCEWPKPEEQLVRDKDGQYKLYKPQSLSTKLKRFFTDYTKNPEVDLFERWSNWEDRHEEIERECGPWPGMCITHTPEDQIIRYACRDVDALIRLWPVLCHMKTQIRKKPQENWERKAA